MSVIDEVLAANQAYSEQFRIGHLPPPPARRLAVVACMDARLDVELALGLQPGEAHIIRNAGGVVTEDALRSLLVSHYLLGTREVMIINHIGCGMLTVDDAQIKARLLQETGAASVSPAAFHTFTDLEANVREQMQKLHSHPWVPAFVTVRGFIYDVTTGRLAEVPGA